MEPSKVSDFVVSVAAQVFPMLPIEAALTGLGQLLAKPVNEISDEELDVIVLQSLVRQRANYRDGL